MDDPSALEPEYSAEQRLELDQTAFFLNELRLLRDRGLVSAETVAQVEGEKAARRAEIERIARATEALKAACVLSKGSLRLAEALVLAEKARGLAPERVEAWEVSADLLGRLGEYERAIAVCREGDERHGHASLRSRGATFEAQQRERDRTIAVEGLAARAVAAADRGDYEEAFTTSIVMRSHSGTVRIVEGRHRRDRLRVRI
jgi:tetratricopeptide (TPR) repeat protein